MLKQEFENLKFGAVTVAGSTGLNFSKSSHCPNG
jgi:hypothetical protein